MSEWYIAAPSHNAGNTAVMAANSLHLAIYYATNVRNLAKPLSRAVPIAELSSQGQRQEMDIWRMRNASSNDGVHERLERLERLGGD